MILIHIFLILQRELHFDFLNFESYARRIQNDRKYTEEKPGCKVVFVVVMQIRLRTAVSMRIIFMFFRSIRIKQII